MQTPKIEGISGTKKPPRMRYRRNYEKRILLQRRPGQNWRGRRRR